MSKAGGRKRVQLRTPSKLPVKLKVTNCEPTPGNEQVQQRIQSQQCKGSLNGALTNIRRILGSEDHQNNGDADLPRFGFVAGVVDNVPESPWDDEISLAMEDEMK